MDRLTAFFSHRDGTVPERGPLQALEPDPMRFDRGESAKKSRKFAPK